MSLQELEFYKYATPTYENFIGFVKRYLAPKMKMTLVEEEYYRVLWEAQWTHRRIDAQISRGHSKSELLGVWSTLYMAILQPANPFYQEAHGTKKRITDQLVVSSDRTTTLELFDRIKDFLNNVDEFTHLIPARRDDNKWNNEKIELNNGSTIYARSIQMKRGLHVDRILCDDLTTESSALTDEETWDFFTGALLPMSTAKQAMIMVDGTPIRATDIMGQLARDESWFHIKLPAIIDYDKKVVLSPNRFTWEMLMDIKRTQGSVKFEAEYMLNPIDDTVSLIKREWVRQCYDTTHKISKTRGRYTNVYLGVDIAFSDRKGADHSVFFILGEHENRFYMLDYVRRQGMSGMEQLDYIRDLHDTYRFDNIGVEENSLRAIVPEIRNMSLPIKLFRTGQVDEKDKQNPDFSRTIAVSKRNLVLRLGTTFENKMITIPYYGEEAREKAERLLDECVSWAQEDGKLIELGVHPDVPIALGYALEVATKSSFTFELSYG